MSAAARSLTLLASAALVSLTVFPSPALAQGAKRKPSLSRDLKERLQLGDPLPTSVIISGSAAQIDAVAARHGLTIRKRLKTGAVLDVPAGSLSLVADDGDVDLVSGNHIVHSNMAVTNVAIGADQAWAGDWAPGATAVTGKGVGVAVIDSGVANMQELKGRIAARLDLTDAKGNGLDGWGHGTHVAGIIAASSKREDVRGVAPDATLVSLKVLGDDGTGYLSDVIEAIDWSVANRAKYGLKVINLSLGTAPQQSWRTDPVCHAIERAFTAGITVVAAAGNRGRTDKGDPVFGTIDSPGHCPHAITVGALNTKGTPWRSDDVMASYSSKGPTGDGLVKPDLVAPGHKVRGLLAPKSGIAEAHPEFVIGTGNGGMLELSGTSMSAAVTSGAAALLAGSDATPLEVRIRLQYSAERTTAALVIEGAGRLNVLGALAQNESHSTVIASETIQASQLVFAHGLVLGSYDDNIIWSNGDNIIWSNGDNVVWSNYDDNIVWSNFAYSAPFE